VLNLVDNLLHGQCMHACNFCQRGCSRHARACEEKSVYESDAVRLVLPWPRMQGGWSILTDRRRRTGR
jgi:hypothetical protein